MQTKAHMKKKRFSRKIKIILLSAAALIVLTASAVVLPKIGSKDEKSTKEFLFEAGFKTVPNLTGSRLADYWKSTYDLRFFSFKDMDTLCKLNDFDVRPAEEFIDIIPEPAATEMRKNYQKIKNDLYGYEFYAYNDPRAHFFLCGPECVTNHKSVTGSKLFTLSGQEVTSKIRHKDRYCGEVTRWWPQWDRDCNISRVIKDEYIARYNINTDSIEDNWIMIKDKDASKIYIVAPKEKFQEPDFVADANGLIFPEPPPVIHRKDPLAVVKHRGGWVVLAHWK